MFKLLIADDEKIIRQGIEKGIPWSEHGFQIVGVASNGFEALEIAEGSIPDLLITDISMPEMNGIELVDRIKNIHNHISVIILTGYDSFEYAQQAIELNVNSYVLKPVDPQLLLEKACKIKSLKEREQLALLKELDLFKEKYRTELSVNDQLQCANNNRPDEKQNVKCSKIIEMIKEFLDTHYMENINLSQVAEKFSFSYSYLSLLFKKETEYNLTEYLNMIRIEKSKVLLDDPMKKIYEVAYAVGIDDSHYFARLFKKHVGISASEYRNKST